MLYTKIIKQFVRQECMGHSKKTQSTYWKALVVLSDNTNIFLYAVQKCKNESKPLEWQERIPYLPSDLTL